MADLHPVTDPPRVVLHPDRPPGVQDAVLDLAARGVVDLVDATSDADTAAALQVSGSVLVSYRWRPEFLTDGLSWIQTLGVGVDQFPRRELAGRGVTLCNARGVMAGCVAEHAIALLLSMTRRLLDSRDDQRAHTWTPRTGAELSQLTLGVVGLGAIGRQVAVRAGAFGMTVLGLRRTPGPVAGVDEVMGPDRIDELCDRSNALVICLPGGDATRGLLGGEQLRRLGDGWLVNVGRGGTVDETALVDALHRGSLRGAALDVVDGEPLSARSPLWDTPRLLLTGHSAALSPRWGADWATLFTRNIAAATGGGPWASVVPWEPPET